MLRTEHIRGGERWGPPHSLPLQYRASTALAGWGHVPSPVPPQRAEVTGGAAHVPPPLQWSRASIDGIAAAQPAASAKSGVEKCVPGPPGPGSEVNGPRAGRRAGARRRRRGAARCGPRAGQCPGGGAARGCSGVKAATAAVVEERGSRRSEPGPRGRGAERRGAGCVPGRPPAAAPRARRAERRRAGPRAGPRRPEPARGTILQGVSAEGREKLGGAGVLARDRLTGLKNAGEGGGAWYEIAASVCCKSQQNQAGERA